MLLSIVPVVALVELNVRLEDCPAVMVEGVAVKLAVGGALEPLELDDEPPQLVSMTVAPASNTKNLPLPRKHSRNDFLMAVKIPIPSSIGLVIL
jgi:hypothetical protein